MDYNTWCSAFRTEPFLKWYHETKNPTRKCSNIQKISFLVQRLFDEVINKPIYNLKNENSVVLANIEQCSIKSCLLAVK